MRMARFIVGTLDVDAMLDSITPEQFNEWLAYFQIDHVDDPWMQTAMICSVVQNWLYLTSAEKPKEKHLMAPKDFLPGAAPKKRKRMSGRDLERHFAQLFPK